MPTKLSVSIIGPGKVGLTLAVLLRRAGWPVAIGGRDVSRAAQAAAAVGAEVGSGLAHQVAPLGQLVLLTVPDDAIAGVCAELAAAGAFEPGAVVAHCSGALASDVLGPARRAGCHVASLHPLQTFPSVEAGVRRFAGTYCFCEGDEQALAVLEPLAAELGGRPVRLRTDGKLLYHAAAVMACNYFVALLDAAVATAGQAGIAPEQALAALEPLVRATLENVMRLGPAKALTGPIARGDAALVARQARELAAADARLGAIYRLLGGWTVDVALRKGTIDQARAADLRKVLGE